jgi:hypothetical protein
MKVRMAVLSASILGLAACATTGETTSYTPPAQDQPSIMDYDEEYMARVEAYARRRGIDLVWVHPPRGGVAQKDE